MSTSSVSIIIPAFNEAANIAGIVEQVRMLHPQHEIIVVDDGSTDGTAQVAHEAGAQVMIHPYNIGNGAAVKTGIRASTGEVLVFMDGDGQHDPTNIQEMIKRIPQYDMVVGARTLSQQASWLRAFANSVFNWFATYITMFKIQDLTSGFRAVKRSVAFSFLNLLPNTYSYPSTLTMGVIRSGFSLKYIPVNVSCRKSGSSKINHIQDGTRFFMIIMKICTIFAPLRIFLPVSLSCFVLGLLRHIYTFVDQGRFTNISVLMYTTSVIVFLMGLISEQICQMRFERRAYHQGRRLTDRTAGSPENK